MFRPKGPEDVIVTGTFDNWSKSLPLVKQTDGSFSLQVPLPPKAEDVIYKYVVDGEWRINSDENITKDESGIENNIISKDHLKELIAVPGSLIPESGLPVTTPTAQPVSDNQDTLKTTVLPKEEPHHPSLAGEPGIVIPKEKDALSAFEKVEDADAKALNKNVTEVGTANAEAQTGSDNQDTLKTTVLPKEEPHHLSLAGEPGIVIPKEKDALSAFEKVEDTDAKALNENVTEVGTANAEPNSLNAVPSTGVLVEGSELTPEERKKQKKKVKKSQYKARKKQRAAEAAAGEANSTSDIDTEEATPEPTTQAKENNHSKAAAVGLAAAGTGGAAAATIAATTALADHPDTLGSTTNGGHITSKDPVQPPVYEPQTSIEKPKDSVTEPKLDSKLKTTGLPESKIDDNIVSTGPEKSLDQTVDSVAVPKEPESDIKETTTAPVPVPVPIQETKAEPAVDQTTAAPIPVQETETEPEPVVATSKDVAPADYANEPIDTTEEHPKTLDPNAVVPDFEAKEVDASPVVKESRNTHETAQDEEEIIIAAEGSEKDITAAVEAREGAGVTLEEIQPTQSEKERLTREAKLAAGIDGPVTVEKINVPEDELKSQKVESPTKEASPTTKKAEPEKKNTVKKSTTNGKTEEKKKGSFRRFLKKIFN